MTQIGNNIQQNIINFRRYLDQICQKNNRNGKVNMVVVSKCQGVDKVIEAYMAGERHFGENYVKEIIDKAPKLPKDIYWHFIGHLQSNKCNTLLENVPNLHTIHSLDSIKLANELQRSLNNLEKKNFHNDSNDIQNNLQKASLKLLNVLIQINTSNTISQSGIRDEKSCIELVNHINDNCNHLKFKGLMTIGDVDSSKCEISFKELVRLRNKIIEECQKSREIFKDEEFILSMGMTNDFELAIENYTTTIRIGTAIFGKRI